MNKIYLLAVEGNVNKELSHNLQRRGYLIETYNGLWHLSKYGGNKYDCLNYMLGCEDYFHTQYVIVVWHEKYIMTDDAKRLVKLCYELIKDQPMNRKTKVLFVDYTGMRMKECADMIYRQIENEDITKYHINNIIEFPSGINIFELVE